MLNVNFLLEETEPGTAPQVLAFFVNHPQNEDRVKLHVFSPQDGHTTATADYLETLEPAQPEQYRRIAKQLRQEYGYEINILKS